MTANSTRKTGLMPLRTQDSQLSRWAEGVLEQLEVLHGTRGSPLDRAVTLRDLQAIGFDVAALSVNRVGSLSARDGVTAAAAPLVEAAAKRAISQADMDAFAQAITDTALFKELMEPLQWRSVNAQDRFDWVPEQLRRELMKSIAEEAAKRGTDISRVEQVVKDGASRFARKLEEITASIGEAAAGVRQLNFAYADADRAIAGQVTQLGATLGQNIATLEQALSTEATKTSAIASSVSTLQTRVGAAESAITNEQTARASGDSANAISISQVQARLNTGDFAAVKTESSATATKVNGLEARYTLKVTAGGAFAGIGLAATENSAGNATSAIILTADKFAIVAPNYSGGLTTTPPASSVPFGIENLANGGSRIYMNTNVRVRGGVDISAVYGTNGAWDADALMSVRFPNFQDNWSFYWGQSPSKVTVTGANAGQFYAAHYGLASGSSAVSVGVIGEAIGQGNNVAIGVMGSATGGSHSIGGVFSGETSSLWLKGSGFIQWKNVAVSPPDGSSGKFLNAAGQWIAPPSNGVTSFNSRSGPVSLSSSDVTNALGYTPPTQSSVSDDINANNTNYVAQNYSQKSHTHSSAPYANDAGALGGVAASSYLRFSGSIAYGNKTFAAYAQVLVNGSYYWIPVYV